MYARAREADSLPHFLYAALRLAIRIMREKRPDCCLRVQGAIAVRTGPHTDSALHHSRRKRKAHCQTHVADLRTRCCVSSSQWWCVCDDRIKSQQFAYFTVLGEALANAVKRPDHGQHRVNKSHKHYILLSLSLFLSVPF